LSRGVSLVEVLVGVAIALVTALVIFQVFLASTTSSRTATAGSEAQMAGNIGMFELERDLKEAGMGFGTLTSMSAAGVPCAVLATNPAVGAAAFTFPLVPVMITPGGAGVPDQIDVLYGNSAYMTAGRGYGSGTTTSKTTSMSRGGIQLGDLAILANALAVSAVAPPTVCEMVEITGNASPDNFTVEHTQGGNYTSFYTGTPKVATRNRAVTQAALNGPGVLYNMGPQPRLNQWRVANNSLGFANLLGDNAASAVAEGVVDLKAEYGVDADAPGTAGAGQISAAEWTTVAPADWSRVLAVRFAVLARSPQAERTAVTTAAPTWANGANNFTMLNLDGTVGTLGVIAPGTPWDANDWRYYRYRVFQGVVPMRNVIWGTAPLPP
jgi:type IV pilus assembly protein PilW